MEDASALQCLVHSQDHDSLKDAELDQETILFVTKYQAFQECVKVPALDTYIYIYICIIHHFSFSAFQVDTDQYLKLIDSGIARSFCVKCKKLHNMICGTWLIWHEDQHQQWDGTDECFRSHGCYVRPPWILMIPIRNLCALSAAPYDLISNLSQNMHSGENRTLPTLVLFLGKWSLAGSVVEAFSFAEGYCRGLRFLMNGAQHCQWHPAFCRLISRDWEPADTRFACGTEIQGAQQDDGHAHCWDKLIFLLVMIWYCPGL